ncbi:ankyrin repeat domain-containing protein [Saccharibacillus alkalitolerans]|uniref:Ankyrin repeat domain-containing protein n=1 Tax=Saccharibacillus alkalitolerans TaxID=2705290 RepID=A0ABX0FE39_9BACL|nr:ankyrin repeat domain-containing protein [Saccharibacillus alkalitolerans]NGZ76902.1 ankyrin repeat domain-containing protein [Saccharibacillus alkalitolerans]
MDIFKAIQDGQTEAVERYLTGGADPNRIYENGWTLLKAAAEHEQPEIVKLLVEGGADVNLQPDGGWTALHQAVDIAIDGTIQTGGQPGDEPVAIIRYLLEHGADPELRDTDGQHALDIAEAYRSEKVIAVLQSGMPRSNPESDRNNPGSV